MWETSTMWRVSYHMYVIYIYIYIYIYMAMDQYLLIQFLVGWTSIYQLFWCELQGYKVLTHCHINIVIMRNRTICHIIDTDNIYIYIYINMTGHLRILKWRYLPYIRPIFQAWISGNIPTKYGQKYGTKRTSILGSWNFHWIYIYIYPLVI